MLLRHRHAHGHRESLAERSGGHFHAVGIAVFGMSRCLRSILPKLFEVRDREVVPGQVQHAIEHRGSMPVREHKAVAIGPLRVLRIVPHVFVKEEINHRRIAQRRTGVPAICLFHRVDGKKPQGVNRQLIEFAHKSSLLFGFCLGVNPAGKSNPDVMPIFSLLGWMTQMRQRSLRKAARSRLRSCGLPTGFPLARTE